MSATLTASSRYTFPSSASAVTDVTESAARRWSGRVLLAVGLLFLVFDTVLKVTRAAAADAATTVLGFQPEQIFTIGLIELACLVLYAIPRTAPIGALLFTGYLGGAIVTHFRVGNPLFSHTLFPIYLAAILWGALYLRDARVRALLSPRR